MNFKITKTSGIDIISILGNGFSLSFLNHGATLYEWVVGKNEIVMNYKDVSNYQNDKMWLGKTIGKFAGRFENKETKIGNSILKKQGDRIAILHSGKSSSELIFKYEIFQHKKNIVIEFHTTINEEYDGIPGDLKLVVKYTIDISGDMRIDYTASSNKDTICNITNHAYFNLSENNEDVLSHKIGDDLSGYWSIDENSLPKEFINLNSSEKSLKELSEEMNIPNNIDNPFKLKDNEMKIWNHNKSLGLHINSSYPDVILYTQNSPTPFATNFGSAGIINKAVAIENQFVPNEFNLSSEKFTILKKDEIIKNFVCFKIMK